MSLSKEPRLDKSSVSDLIRAAENRHGKMNSEDFFFLIDAITEFVEGAVDKFVAGAAEHTDDGGCFVENVNHSRELSNELFDAWFYHSANKRKHETQNRPNSNPAGNA